MSVTNHNNSGRGLPGPILGIKNLRAGGGSSRNLPAPDSVGGVVAEFVPVNCSNRPVSAPAVSRIMDGALSEHFCNKYRRNYIWGTYF